MTNVDAGAESSAESATAPPAAVPESPKSPKPPEPPDLHKWEFNADGSVSGRVYGSWASEEDLPLPGGAVPMDFILTWSRYARASSTLS